MKTNKLIQPSFYCLTLVEKQLKKINSVDVSPTHCWFITIFEVGCVLQFFLWIKVWVYCVNLNKILDYFFQSVPCPRVIGLFSTHFTNLFLWRMGTQDNQDDQENLVTITNPIQEKKKIRDHIKICLAKKKIDYFQTSMFFFQ